MRASYVTVTPFDFEKEIEACFASDGRAVFWAEQFQDLAPIAKATEALLHLAQGGKLRCMVHLRCSEGHSVWSDEIARLDEGWKCECPDCEEPGTLPESPFVHFEIAERWLDELKKKARLLGPRRRSTR